jgi:hypothetical protein
LPCRDSYLRASIHCEQAFAAAQRGAASHLCEPVHDTLTNGLA